VVEQLLANNGVVIRGSLGLETQSVDARVAEALKLQNPRGALVTRVYPGSGAAAGGVQSGDVIVAVNGQRVQDAPSLHNFEGLQPVGSTLSLEVIRDGRR
jgi:S1-C subfamily serine protease